MIGDAARRDPDREDRASAIAPSIQAIKQLAHPCRRGAVLPVDLAGAFAAVLVQDLAKAAEKPAVQRRSPRDDHAHVDRPRFVEGRKGIKIAVVCLILAVPFKIERHPSVDEIYPMAVKEPFADIGLIDFAALGWKQLDMQIRGNSHFAP